MAKKPRADWIAQAQCEGKHRFTDAGLAKKVARQSSRRRDSKASAYRCLVCHGWHVGNSAPMKKRDPRKDYK